MKQTSLAALLVVCLLPAPSYAVELKNIRPCYGPLGATRYDKKLLPGDLMFMTYDIEELVIDAKTGKASYVTILELLDSQGKSVFKKETPNEAMPQLGGTRMPGDLHLVMGAKQSPGQYTLKLTVHDKYGKDAKAFKYDFEVMAPSFGLVGVTAPAIGFLGQHGGPGLAIVNMKLNAKKQPDVELVFRVLDQNNKPVAPDVYQSYPRDLPEGSDLEKENFVASPFLIYLNRVGRFTVEVVANDKLANKKTELRYPFTVVDINNFTGK